MSFGRDGRLSVISFCFDDLVYGSWYTIPVMKDNVGFPDIACLLPPGGYKEERYPLDIFGPLESGTYKLVVEGLGVEFVVK